jgi:serine protease Do
LPAISAIGTCLWATTLWGVPGAVGLTNQPVLISQSQDDGYQYVRDAETKISNKDFQGAIASATRAIQVRSNPRYAYSHYLRAVARLSLRDAQGAISDINLAFKFGFVLSGPYAVRANARAQLRDFQGAIVDADQAIRLNPKLAYSYIVRANVRATIGDYRRALLDVNQALQLDPKLFASYTLRAAIREEQKDYQGALSDADRAIQLAAKEPFGYYARSVVNNKLGNFQQALADAKYAKQLAPKDPSPFMAEAEALIGLKDYPGAISAAERALAIDPKGAEAYYYRGLARLRQGDTQRAIADYDRAIQLRPVLAKIYDNYPRLARQGVKSNPIATAIQSPPPPAASSQQPLPASKPAPVATVQSPSSTPIAAAAPPPSTRNVYKTASQITVLISGQTTQGSGVIVAKTGETYYVLTAKHVVDTPGKYEIIDADKKRYPIDYGKVKKLANVDLVIVQFTSNQAYAIAQLGNSQQVQEGDSILVAGWPAPDSAITQPSRQVTPGQITGFQSGGADGYELVYNNTTSPGMSGGPVFNVAGEVIGIHGRASGSQERGKTGFNLGIPINLFLQLAPQAGLNLQQMGLKAEK